MTDYSVVIDLILNGLGDIDALGKSLSKLRRSAKDAEGAGSSLGKVESGAQRAGKAVEGLGDSLEAGRAGTLAYARALASLQAAQGQLKAASGTLSQALRREQEDTAATIRAKQELAAIDAKLAASQSKGASEQAKNAGVAAAELRKVETQTLNNAKALAALKSAQGDQAGAAKILKDALGKVTQETTAVTAAKRQLAATEAQLTTASGKQQANLLREAQLLARIQQLKGNQAGGASILRDALAKVDPNSLNALRAKIQEIYFDTDYKNSPLIGSIRSLQGGLAQLAPFFGRAGTAAGAFAGQAGQASGAISGIAGGAALSIPVVGTLIATLLGIGAAVSIIESVADALAKIGEVGLQTNRQIETMRFGVAAVIAGTSQISKAGVPVEGAEKFAAAFALAGEQIEKIREEAVKLGIPVQETVEGFQIALGPLTRMGLGLEDARKSTLSIIVAMRDLGIPLREIGQETRGLLQGDTSRQSRLNSILRITKEELAEAKKRGEVQKLLNERLADFTLAGEAFRKSFEGGIQASEAALKGFAARVSQNLFETLRDKMAGVFDQIDAAGGLESAFQGVAESLSNVFEIASEDATDLIDFIVASLGEIDEFLSDNESTITQIVSAVDELVRLTALMLEDILGIDELNDGQPTKLRAINTLLKIAVGLWGLISEGIGAIIRVVQIVGNTLYDAFIITLSGIAKLISQILKPFAFISDTAAQISQDLSNIGFAGLQNTARQAVNFGNDLLNFGKRTSDAISRIDTAEARLEERRSRRLQARKKSNQTDGLDSKGNPEKKGDDDKKNKAARAKEAKDNVEVVLKAEEGLQKALLALKQAYFERGQQAAKNNLETETAALELQLEDRLIGLTDFFTKKKALLAESTRLEIEAINRQIEAERARFAEVEATENKQRAAAREEEQRQLKGAKNEQQRARIKENTAQKLDAIGIEAEKERLDIDAKILKLQAEIDKAEAEGVEKTAQAARKRLEMYRTLVNELRSAGQELNELTGKKLEAALDSIDQRFEELLQKTRLEFGETSKEVEKLLALIAKLKENARLDDELTKLRNAQSIAQSGLDLAQTNVETRRLQGLITERQARREILQLQRQYVAAVLPQLEAEIKATRALGAAHEAEAAALEAKAASLKQLTIDTDTLNLRLSRALEDGLLNALEQIGEQIQTIQDFFVEMANIVLREIKRITAEKIVDALFGSRKGADGQETKGPVPSLIDKIVDIFTGKKGEKPAGALGGVLSPATGPQAEIQATQANTQALLALTQALTGATGGIAGNVAGAAGGGGGDLLGNLISGGLGIISGIFGKKSKGGDSFTPGPETTVLGPTTPGPDDAAGAAGTVAGQVLDGITGAATGQSGGGLLGSVTSLIDAINQNTLALYDVQTALTGVAGPQAGVLDQGGGFDLGGIVSGVVGGVVGLFTGGDEGGGGGGGFGLLDGIFGAVTGVGTSTNILDGVNQLITITKKIEQNTQQQGGGFGGGGASGLLALFAGGGFDEGGWTGPGPISKAAGVVHGGEFVFSAPAVGNLGLGYLNSLHEAARHGYADGGFALPLEGGPMLSNYHPAPIGKDGSGVTVINAATDDEVEQAREDARGRGDKVLVNKIFRNRRAIKRL